MAIGKFAVGLAAAGLLAGTAAAQSVVVSTKPYSSVYVFGDSLSDNGNAADALGFNFPNPPSFHDSFTNGAVAVQVMAQRLGLNANASLFPTGGVDVHGLGLTAGTNYAFAGSTAGSTGGQPGANLTDQVNAFKLAVGGVADPNALYTVFTGGNDVRAVAHSGTAALVTTGVTTELAQILSLYTAGARNFLIVNVPDIGGIPEFQLGYPSQVATASADSLIFNQNLASGVASLAAANTAGSFKLFDLYSLNASYLANPGSLGITNTTLPCYTATNPLSGFSSATTAACGPIDPTTNQATNIGSFYYWDTIHPTAKVQAALGNALADAVTGVPEPSTWLSMITGFAFVGAVLRRRRRAPVRALA